MEVIEELLERGFDVTVPNAQNLRPDQIADMAGHTNLGAQVRLTKGLRVLIFGNSADLTWNPSANEQDP